MSKINRVIITGNQREIIDKHALARVIIRLARLRLRQREQEAQEQEERTESAS